jgi:hypothetical protein
VRKIDLKKELKHLYQPPRNTVVEVDVPTLNYLMIDGEGDPNSSSAYVQAVEALFAVSYTTKFIVKKGPQAIDYAVMPLEGLWWADDMSTFSVDDKSNWKWTMMIMQPEFVAQQTIHDAIASVMKKKPSISAVSGLRTELFSEGRCAQTMHVGPFSEEGPTVEKVHHFISTRGRLVGKHHEVYLSDIRKADPSRWRTVIRQPMQ